MIKVSLVRVTNDPIMAMASAGSNCYDSVPKEGIIKHCYGSGHHSVMEFSNFHFHIEGISRATSHQLVRHRLASYAQRSQRYVLEDNFKYIIPSTIEKAGFSEPYVKHMMNTKCLYERMTKAGIPAEDARFVLPNACETIIDVSMNFRELMSFMNQRLCARAQWEIRELANEMRSIIIRDYPELSDYLVPKCETHSPYNFCTEKKGCGKHKPLKSFFE